MKPNINSRRLLYATFTSLCITASPSAFAGTIWDGGGGATTNINTAANWDADVVNSLNGTTAATFGTGGATATINANASFTGITINRDAAFTIADGSGSLTVGSGGITVTLPNTTARTHVISESNLTLGANQTWSVTNNTGAARLDVNSIIAGAFSITKIGSGTLALGGNNTFSGGINLNEGTLLVQTSANALGTGTLNIGNTTGSTNATLSLSQTLNFANAINVRSGNTGTMTINNGGFSGANLAGTVTLNKGLTINNNDTSAPYGDLTVGGKITGSGALTITAGNSLGQIILNNASNDYTGATAVNSGTLRLRGNLGNTAVTVASAASVAGEGSIGSGSLTFNNGSIIRVDASTSGALSVTGNLTLNATTNVTLEAVPAITGTETAIRLLNYSGTLTGSSSNLSLLNSTNYRNPVFSTATANQVNLSIDTKSLTWSGSSAAWDINTSSNWQTGAEKFYTGDAVTFTDAGTNKSVTLDVTVLPSTVSFDNSAGNDYSLTGTGVISGFSTTLSKNNSGTLTLSTPNTYAGGTTISGGKIIATVAGALGTGSVTNNATLDLTGGAVTYTGLSSSMSGSGITNVTLSTGSSSTPLNGDYSGFTGTWNLGVGAAAGAGKAQMNGLDHSSSTINVSSNSTLYVSAAVTKTAALILNGGDTGESLGQLRIESGATWSGPITLAGDITGTNDGTIGCNGGGGIISGNISESGGSRALIKVGPSTITLSGTNTYTGATSINAGILRLGSVGALGNGSLNTSGVTVSGSAILDLNGFSQSSAAPLTLNSTANGFDVGAFYNGGASAVTYSGTVTLNAATTRIGAGNITLNNTITGNGKNLTRDGLGTLELSNSGSVSLGTLSVNRGSIQINNGTTLNVTGISVGTGNGVGSGIILNGGNLISSSATAATFASSTNAQASGTLTLSGGTLTVFGLTKGGTAVAAFTTNFNGGTLKATADNAAFFTGANNAKVQAGGALIDDGGFLITIAQPLIHDTAVTTQDGGLTKSGLGTLTLSGANTYNGNTTVNAGTLELAASTGSLKFFPTTNGVSNKVTGTGAVNLKGVFNIDLTGANAIVGNSWTLVDVGTLTENFDASFSIAGFTETSNVWTKPDGANVWKFDEATGVLTYSATSTYTAWIEGNWSSLSDKTNTGDPDKDGIPNLLEFVLNGDPSTANTAILPSLVVTATDYEFTFSRRDDSLSPETTQVFQYGTDLSTWTSIIIPASSQVVDAATVTVTDGSPADTVKISIPKSTVAPETKLFGRLQVTK